MSKVTELKSLVTAIGQQAKTISGGLTGFKSKFDKGISDVSATMGGTASGADQQVIDTLQNAQKQVDSAIQALEQAARTCNQYAQSV